MPSCFSSPSPLPPSPSPPATCHRLMPGCLPPPKWGHAQAGPAASPRPSPALPSAAAHPGYSCGMGLRGGLILVLGQVDLAYPAVAANWSHFLKGCFAPVPPLSAPPPLWECPEAADPLLPPLCTSSCESPSHMVPFTSALALAAPQARVLQKKQKRRESRRSWAVDPDCSQRGTRTLWERQWI